MSEKHAPPNRPERLTEEVIREQTGFSLQAIYPDFARKGHISPSVKADAERLSEEFGEDNVITSLHYDDEGVIQLGLFLRSTEET